jgi:predicted nucleic acid-binding protein
VIYLDANVIIRLIEGTPAARATLDARLASTRGTGRVWTTSRLTRLECRCKPMRQADQPLLDRYEQFLTGTEMVVLEVDDPVIEKATDLRARLNVKTPDAIHLASAIVAGASALLTGDQALARCTDVAVEVM